jgi:hypothetical protein
MSVVVEVEDGGEEAVELEIRKDVRSGTEREE